MSLSTDYPKNKALLHEVLYFLSNPKDWYGIRRKATAWHHASASILLRIDYIPPTVDYIHGVAVITFRLRRITYNAPHCFIFAFILQYPKRSCLLFSTDMLGVDRKATINMGDSGNDITMVQSAGLELAVSHSVPILKDAADEIICNNEEHVVKYVLEKYFG